MIVSAREATCAFTLTFTRMASVFLFVGLLATGGVAAHTPHDTVDTPVEFSRNFTENGTAWVIMSGTLKRTTDAGYSWHLVTGGERQTGSLLAVMLFDGPGGESLVTVSLDGMTRSADAGRTWRDVTGGIALGRLRGFATQRTAAGRRPLVAGDDGLFRLEPDGTWARLLDRPVSVLGLGNSERLQPIAAVTGDEVAVSSDGGATWAFRSLRLDTDESATAVHVLGGLVFIGTSHGRVLRLAADGRADQVLQVLRAEDETDDEIVAAHSVVLGADLPGADAIPSIADLTSRRLGGGGTQVCALSAHAGLLCSTDIGNTWIWRNQGLTKDSQALPFAHGRHFTGIRIAPPFDAVSLTFVSGFDGLFRSSDSGASWQQVDLMYPQLVIDVAQTTLPDGRRCIAFGTYAAGVYLSPDDGLEWEILNSGLHPETPVYDVRFLPNVESCHDIAAAAYLGPMFWNPASGSWDPWFTQDVYLEIFEGGSERGSLATRVMRKLGLVDFDWPIEAWRLPMRVTGDGVHTVLATRKGGLFTAERLGGTWRQLPRRDGWIYDVQLSPAVATDRTLFAVLADRVERSTDGGNSWTTLPVAVADWPDFRHWGVPEIRLSADFEADGTVYVRSAAGLALSRDRGESWQDVDLPTTCSGRTVHAFESAQRDDLGAVDWITVRGCGMFRRENGGSWRRLDGPGRLGELRYLRASEAGQDPGLLLGADEQTLYASADDGATRASLVAPVRVEDFYDTLAFQGPWSQVRSTRASSGSVRVSAQTGATAMLSFDGQAVRVAARRAPEAAALRLSVDGEPRLELDCAGAADAPCLSDWIDDLSSGRHSLVVEVLDTNDGSGSAYLDAVDVMPHPTRGSIEPRATTLHNASSASP